MPVWKRHNGKRVKRGDKNYDRGTWIAEGQVGTTRYKEPLPKESIKTLEDARREDDRIRTKIRGGDYIKDKITFSTFVDDTYLPFCRLHNESYKQKIIECKKLQEFFGDALLSSISAEKCEEYTQWRSKQKKRCQKCISGTHTRCTAGAVANSTVNRELTTLQRLFEIAVINNKIKANPMKRVKKLKEPPPRDRFLTMEEKARLMEAVSQNKHLRYIVPIALWTGWRKRQILSIRKKDLDHARQWVTICASKQNAQRKVQVSQSVWNILLELAAVADDYLFTNQAGGPLGDFKEAWWNALKIAGIEDFHFHDLRHTFATDLLALGAGEFLIQTALGHKNLKTTKIYAHVQNHSLLNALEAVSTPIGHTISTPTDVIQ